MSHMTMQSPILNDWLKYILAKTMSVEIICDRKVKIDLVKYRLGLKYVYNFLKSRSYFY